MAEFGGSYHFITNKEKMHSFEEGKKAKHTPVCFLRKLGSFWGGVNVQSNSGLDQNSGLVSLWSA